MVDLPGHEAGPALPPSVSRTPEPPHDAPRRQRDPEPAPRRDGGGPGQRAPVPPGRDAPQRGPAGGVREVRTEGWESLSLGRDPVRIPERIRTEALRTNVPTAGYPHR